MIRCGASRAGATGGFGKHNTRYIFSTNPGGRSESNGSSGWSYYIMKLLGGADVLEQKLQKHPRRART
jgi:hypothetical protein